MTTSISLDQSKHLVQSFDELTYQAADLCQHIDDLKTETTSQIKKLENYFKQAEKLRGGGVIPLYDMENLYQFIMGRVFPSLIRHLITYPKKNGVLNSFYETMKSP